MASHAIRTAVATLLVGMSIVPIALGATGEPKNQPPFTRPVATGSRIPTDAAPQQPSQTSGAGEAKNEPPFNRPVSAPVVVAGSSGFSWGDAGIGVLAGFGLAAVAAGGLTLAGSRRRPLRPSL
jgi:hypothetical protein